jgi:hypothetical protein
MPADYSQIAPFVFAALLIFLVYRRFRRNFGRQPLRSKRMTFRIVLLSVIGTLLLPSALKSTQFLGAVIGGLALGLALALWGTQRTRFLRTEGQLYYIPHTYTGVVVSMLFLGRLVFRVLQIRAGTAMPAGADPNDAFQMHQMVKSPLTVGIFFVLIAYYVYFYCWVLWKSKHLAEADIESTADPLAEI